MLELLYASIVSAISNVVDFMVCTSEFIGIEPAQSACQPYKPVIQTVDADGTSRYFDVQGRMLNGKPQKRIYIENDRKVLR